MPSVDTCLRHEGFIESAVLSVLLEAGLPAVTRLTLRKLAKPTPRVEIQLKVGGTTQHRHKCDDGVLRYDAWTGQIAFQVITTPPDGSEDPDILTDEHEQLRALVRSVCTDLKTQINDAVRLPYHSVNQFYDADSQPTLRSENGLEFSTLTYNIHFNVRPSAWPTQ